MMLNSSPGGRSSLKHSRTSLQNGWIQVCGASTNYPIIGYCILMDPTLRREQGLASCSSHLKVMS
jgi:hypothetical protein